MQHWPGKVVWVFVALVGTMGVRIALTPWLGDAHPVTLAIPVVALVALACGAAWALALAALVLGWVWLPVLPPDWPDESLAYRAVAVLALGVAAVLPALVRRVPAPVAAAPKPARPGVPAQRALRLAMALAAALPLALLGVLAWTSQGAAFDRARQDAEAIARLAAEHAARAVQANTVLARQVRSRLASLPPRPGDGEAQRELHRYLASLAQGMVQINSIWVIGADGYPVASSLFETPPRISYEDREYFRFHRDHREQIHVSRLLRTRSTQELFFDVSARWEGPDGQFLGVVNVTMKPGYFVDFYRETTRRRPALAIALLRTDGDVLARWPDPPEVGERLPDGHAALGAMTGSAEPGWVSSPAGSAHATALVTRLDAFALAVVVGLDHQLVRRGWGEDVAALGALALGASGALVLALWIALRRTENEIGALDRLAREAEQRHRAEEALRQSQKLEALGQLTGSVAHDFNNLLGVIQNNLHLLRLDPHAAAPAPAVAAMQRAVKSGEHLTRKLLSFTRRQALNPEVVDPAAVLPQFENLLRLSVGSAVTLHIEVAPGTPAIEVDRAEFELALLNLVVNARGAIGERGRIDIRAAAAADAELPASLVRAAPGRPGWVVVGVRDDGAGMDAATAERAFEPFFTTKADGHGTGLGLAQVWSLASRAGGTATIRSAPGAGTTVSLYFPAARRAAAAGEPQAADAAAAAAPGRLDVRVLLVDDNAELARATAALLESMGARVGIATSAADATRQLSAPGAAFDVVLSDIVMAGDDDGLAFALEMRRRHPRLPVLLATGHASRVADAAAAGFVVLQKPVGPAMLAARLAEAVRRGREGVGHPA